MKLREIVTESAQSVYIVISGSVGGGAHPGKYRIRSMEKRNGGYDVGIKSWADGFLFVPDSGIKGVTFKMKNGMPISPGQADQLINS
jgi:hypothetical protein